MSRTRVNGVLSVSAFATRLVVLAGAMHTTKRALLHLGCLGLAAISKDDERHCLHQQLQLAHVVSAAQRRDALA